MRRERVGYHGDVANFDWVGAESLEQSALRAYERKCGPCFPVKKGKEKEEFYYHETKTIHRV